MQSALWSWEKTLSLTDTQAIPRKVRLVYSVSREGAAVISDNGVRADKLGETGQVKRNGTYLIDTSLGRPAQKSGRPFLAHLEQHKP